MGPRRRLEIAVKQVKEEMQQELSSGSVPREDTTPTPFKESEKELKVQVMRLQSQLTQVNSLLCCISTCNIYMAACTSKSTFRSGEWGL